jgi:hypothetical protein
MIELVAAFFSGVLVGIGVTGFFTVGQGVPDLPEERAKPVAKPSKHEFWNE